MGFFGSIDASALSTLDCRILRNNLIADYKLTFLPHLKEGEIVVNEYKWLVMNTATNFAIDKYENTRYSRETPRFDISVLINSGVNSLPSYEDFISIIKQEYDS